MNKNFIRFFMNMNEDCSKNFMIFKSALLDMLNSKIHDLAIILTKECYFATGPKKQGHKRFTEELNETKII